MKPFYMVLGLVVLAGCDNTPANNAEFEANLQETLQNRPTGSGAAYGVMKDGMGGPSWLATVHGYPDNRLVCEQLIEPYNNDPDLSVLPGTYYCQEV